MRRIQPDYFRVTRNEELGMDILIPKSADVEHAVDIAAGIDPRTREFPLTWEQLSFINGEGGRGVRRALDFQGWRSSLTADQVLNMTEEQARKALIETVDAPPMSTLAVVEPADDMVRMRELMTKAGITPKQIRVLTKSLEGASRQDMIKGYEAFLKAKCT